jgi:hypothetical protein
MCDVLNIISIVDIWQQYLNIGTFWCELALWGVLPFLGRDLDAWGREYKENSNV